MFELQKSPLNPSLLIRSFNGLGLFIKSIRDEAVEATDSIKQSFLEILMWLVIAALLIWQGAFRIKRTLTSIFSSDNEWQVTAKARLGQFLPFVSSILALISIYYAFKLLLPGAAGSVLVCGLAMFVGLGLAGRWLSKAIFSGDEANEALFKMIDHDIYKPYLKQKGGNTPFSGYDIALIHVILDKKGK